MIIDRILKSCLYQLFSDVGDFLCGFGNFLKGCADDIHKMDGITYTTTVTIEEDE